MADLVQADYPILADETHEVAQAFNVQDLFNDGIAAPAVFIITADGSIEWHYIGKNPDDRPSGLTILEQLSTP